MVWPASRCAITPERESMRTRSYLKRCACGVLTFSVLAVLGTAARSQDRPADLPSFMAPISGPVASSPAETATKNVLALNSMMFELYDDAAAVLDRKSVV